MPISTEERAAAKKAYSEMRSCDMARLIVVMWLLVVLFSFLLFLGSLTGTISVMSDGKDLSGWKAGLSLLSGLTTGPSLGFMVVLIGQMINYLRLRPRYAANLAVVAEIEREHASELPYGLESEVDVPYWNRRGERRALLWRLDAFLSRKPIKSTASNSPTTG